MKNGASKRPKPRAKFRVGEWVAYTMGLSRHAALVVADTGLVGHDPVRVYRLREPIWYGPPVEYEMAETTLEPASEADLDGRYPPDEPPEDRYPISKSYPDE